MKTVMIVEDTEANIDILVKVLEEEYDLMIATNGADALELMLEEEPDIVLLDVMMPVMDGHETIRQMKSDSRLAKIPVIFITALSDTKDKTLGFELGAVDYITKPFQSSEVKARVRTHLELKEMRDILENQNEILEKKVKERTKDLVRSQEAMIYCMAIVAEARDNSTGEHILRTQRFVNEIGKYLEAQKRYLEFNHPQFLDNLTKAAPLHDIGKVAIRDNILLKAGSFDDDEYEEMKKHPRHGRVMLDKAMNAYERNQLLVIASAIALGHHERWDGTGYPNGLSGEKIPLEARIMAVADVFDALVTKRVYKEAFSYEKATELIVEGSGTQFDPAIVEAFLAVKDKIIAISEEFKVIVDDESGEE